MFLGPLKPSLSKNLAPDFIWAPETRRVWGARKLGLDTRPAEECSPALGQPPSGRSLPTLDQGPCSRQ